MDKVCILGIDGFTGRHLEHYVTRQGLTRQFAFYGFARTPTVASFPVTVLQSTDRAALAGALDDLQPNYIVNLIGSPQVDRLEEALLLNATISQWICETIIAGHLPIKKFLAIGSAAEYGHAETLPIRESHPLRPINYYGLAKLWQTTLLEFFHRQANLPINIARTFNIVGSDLPSYTALGSFIQQINSTGTATEIRVGNTQNRRDFLDIDDVIDAYWKILIDSPAGEVYNVCSGQSYALDDLLRHLMTQSGKKLRFKPDAELSRVQDQIDVYGDNAKLRAATSWQPRHDIFTSLKRAVRVVDESVVNP